MSRTRKLKPTELVRISKQVWDEIAKRREADLKLAIRAMEITREALVHYDAKYDHANFPIGFPIQKFCREMVGQKSLHHPDVILLRRSLTALSSITGLMLPKNIVLVDEISHTLAILLAQEAQRMNAEEFANNPAMLDDEAKQALTEAYQEIDKEDIVEAVLSGNTTYDKDPDYVASALHYNKEDVEIKSVAEFQAATGATAK